MIFLLSCGCKGLWGSSGCKPMGVQILPRHLVKVYPCERCSRLNKIRELGIGCWRRKVFRSKTSAVTKWQRHKAITPAQNSDEASLCRKINSLWQLSPMPENLKELLYIERSKGDWQCGFSLWIYVGCFIASIEVAGVIPVFRIGQRKRYQQTLVEHCMRY